MIKQTLSRAEVLRQGFPITVYAVTFYMLCDRHTEGKYDLDDFLDCITDDLWKVFYDYIPLAAFGEARHCARPGVCNYFVEFFSPYKHGSRRSMQSKSISYNPKSFMPIFYDLFDKYWLGGYGGRPWRNIVQSWLWRERLTKKLWVHQVLGLMHNNSYIFDKSPILLEMGSFSTLMLLRSKMGFVFVVEDLKTKLPILRTWPVNLVKELGLQNLRQYYPVVYIPIKWGKKSFDWEIKCSQ